MQEEPLQVYAADRSEWRAWLVKNHASRDEVWLVRYKVHTGKACVSYNDAVEEALCFGWIDGKVRRLDDEKYMIRFTPRRPGSGWSALNITRVEKMMDQGLMMEAGLAEARLAREDGRWEKAMEKEKDKNREPVIPGDLASALGRHRKAFENFKQMAPGYRRDYIRWIERARRAETRQRRVTEVVHRAARNIKPGM